MIQRSILGVITRYLGRLRYPWLFAITAALLVANLLIPDAVPFIDEIILAAVTLLLGARTRDADDGEEHR